jgi:hypothetical protein
MTFLRGNHNKTCWQETGGGFIWWPNANGGPQFELCPLSSAVSVGRNTNFGGNN